MATCATPGNGFPFSSSARSEEHTSELQSQSNLVCRLLLEKKKKPHTDDVDAFASLARSAFQNRDGTVKCLTRNLAVIQVSRYMYKFVTARQVAFHQGIPTQ